VTSSQRRRRPFLRAVEAVKSFACAPPSRVAAGTRATGDDRQRQVFAAETRLLYENATTGIIVSVVIALVLAYVMRSVSAVGVSTWFLYMLVVAAVRFEIARRYWRAMPGDTDSGRWNRAFVAGTALAAAGWGAAGVLFYQTAQPQSGMFLVFVVGGVMLGGASLLAARPEAFLTFLLPTGLLTAMRLAAEGNEEHVMMGFLGALFTAATVATTWRFHQTIASSFNLRFDNADLISNLQTAKGQTDALNRELEARVRDRTARLREADERKDAFLATLAHELRNPLAPIRFALENLKAGSSPAAAAHARDVIERQVRQLVRLVDDLLDVSRITTGKLVLRREPHDLARTMATALESIMPLAIAADHVVTMEPPPAPISVDGDSARLMQVFANVLNNAVKFTPRGGRIWFTAHQDEHGAVVRIRDSGIGIAPDAIPRVFDMFEQAEPILERSRDGLGIGLTLARRLVEMHGGRIEIASPGPGRGTEVTLHLPTTAPPDTHRTTAERPATMASRPLRVLIVEDNPDAATMLEIAVSLLGHTTRVAHDGGTAVTIALQFAPDLILLDIGLPVMSGYAVASTLRERPEFAHVHLAAVTGWGQDEDRRRAREAGCDSHFTKPLAPAALEELLARVAGKDGAARDANATPRTRLADSGSVF
jgi:signal transduction histidine kinase/ActR/RegA family two-component response regulator